MKSAPPSADAFVGGRLLSSGHSPQTMSGNDRAMSDTASFPVPVWAIMAASALER